MSTTPTMQERIESLTPRLRRYAARHSTEIVTADDLYQIAVEEIITHCDPQTHNDAYILRLADWRMRNAANRERVYVARVAEADIEPEDEEEAENLIADLTGSPEEIAIMQEMSAVLQGVVARVEEMGELYKQILGMLADDLSQREIARRLGTSQTRVRYYILKIRETFEQAGLSPALIMA